jgi:thiol-disulfide isomerase/thioredoxin
MIGAAIAQAAAGLPFHDWKLKQAADPLAPKESSDDPGDGSEGKESLLVGKPAPEISLDFVDGNKFRLSEHKGKVVVLDFWASWCGPCLQAMPQIDRVAHEFSDQGVELFAVNLEETADKVTAALERLKLSTSVVLDRNGRVAERYGATSIPQTVIIDREGNVSRVFVGGGARFDEKLRGALTSVLSDNTQKTP